jgi:hypothetical protein
MREGEQPYAGRPTLGLLDEDGERRRVEFDAESLEELLCLLARGRAPPPA